jgi:hypothetical protein
VDEESQDESEDQAEEDFRVTRQPAPTRRL